MPANDLFSKLEARMKAVVDGLGLAATVTINTGNTAETLEPPYVVCAARDTTEEVLLDSNVYEVTAAVIVASNADDTTLAAHRTRAATVFDAFRQDDIAGTLSDETEGIYVYQVHSPIYESQHEDREMIDILAFTVVTCPKHLAA